MRNWLSNNAKIHKEDKFDSGSTGLLQVALGSLEDMGLGGVIAGVAQMSVDEGGFLFTAGAKMLSVCISRNVNLGLTTDTVTCTKPYSKRSNPPPYLVKPLREKDLGALQDMTINHPKNAVNPTSSILSPISTRVRC